MFWKPSLGVGIATGAVFSPKNVNFLRSPPFVWALPQALIFHPIRHFYFLGALLWCLHCPRHFFSPQKALIAAIYSTCADFGALWMPWGSSLEPLGSPGRRLGRAWADARFSRIWEGQSRFSNGSTALLAICGLSPVSRVSRQKWCHQVRLGASLPHTPGVRMT